MRPVLAVSQCLLGNTVRYDGSHARDEWPYDEFASLFELRGICPEIGIGMTVPRDPIQLVGTPIDHRVLGVHDPSIDKTDDLRQFATTTATTLDGVCGYVFMARSPSCGVEDVKVFPSGGGEPVRAGTGAFAAELQRCLPDLPVETSTRLLDPAIRRGFIKRCLGSD